VQGEYHKYLGALIRPYLPIPPPDTDLAPGEIP
jgi:hypothetical protein